MRTLAAPALAGTMFMLSGCIAMAPPTYFPTPETREALQKQGAKFAVAEIAGPKVFEPMCRAVGPVRLSDDMTVGQFIAKGFNDELRVAGVYADTGVRLTGTVTKAEFSSSAALVNGWWDLALDLQSSNGQSMSVAHRHDFEAGFIGASACNNTSRALGPAVQALVRKTVSDPRFAALVR